MPFIEVNLGQAKEPKPVAIGKYDLTVLAADVGQTRVQKKPQFIVTIGIDGHDEAPPVMNYMNIHAEGDEPKTSEFKSLILKRFLTAFGLSVPTNGYDPEQLAMEMVGAKARCDLTLDTEKDSEGNEKVDGRTFNRLQIPRLKDEAGLGASAGAGSKSAPKPPKR